MCVAHLRCQKKNLRIFTNTTKCTVFNCVPLAQPENRKFAKCAKSAKNITPYFSGNAIFCEKGVYHREPVLFGVPRKFPKIFGGKHNTTTNICRYLRILVSKYPREKGPPYRAPYRGVGAIYRRYGIFSKNFKNYNVSHTA